MGVCIYRLLWMLGSQRSVGARSAVDGSLVTKPTFAVRDVMSSLLVGFELPFHPAV